MRLDRFPLLTVAIVGALAFAALHTDPAAADNVSAPKPPRPPPANAAPANAPTPAPSVTRAVHDYARAEVVASPAVRQKLAAMRQQIAAKGYRYEVGATSMVDKPLAQITGARTPAPASDVLRKQAEHTRALLAIERTARADFLRNHPGVLELDPFVAAEGTGVALDLRRHGRVTPVKQQGDCGSCWAFASIAALESSYLVRGDGRMSASEQYLVDCSHAGSCRSGDWLGALAFLTDTGTQSEAGDPYLMRDGTCPAGGTTYSGVAWAALPADNAIASVDTIKAELRANGAVVTGVLATDAFQAYRSGVFNEPAVDGPIVTDTSGARWLNANHAIVIIGFDDSRKAWLIKNSWGTGWGDNCGYGTEGGYMWIDWKSSNVGIGAAFVVAKDPRYVLSPTYADERRKFRMAPVPGPAPEQRRTPTPAPNPAPRQMPPVR